ncbi:hypothetical protein TRAPUB_12607 [Trametes pubescens]|uniref:Uncharacterized protein n=1 Tax=Trametes pubescens TaxID=154538 RepID=A0A1M2VTE8_TRAPU|nr:hypothetical protein TRAPUB_12607 [Trametes pubescens]
MLLIQRLYVPLSVPKMKVQLLDRDRRSRAHTHAVSQRFKRFEGLRAWPQTQLAMDTDPSQQRAPREREVNRLVFFRSGCGLRRVLKRPEQFHKIDAELGVGGWLDDDSQPLE